MTQLPHQDGFSPGQTLRVAFTFASAPTPGEARRIIGERMRAARIAANITQQELAGTTYSKSYISAVERGKMTPSLQVLLILAERLGVSLSYLLGEEALNPAEEATSPALEEHEEHGPDETQATLLSEAEQLLRQGRHEEAIALFERIGQKDQTRWAHERYACFLADQGRFQEAYEQMRHTIAQTAQRIAGEQTR